MKISAPEQEKRWWAKFQQDCERTKQQARDRIVAEFSGNPQALAAEILRYRESLRRLIEACKWTEQGDPWRIIAPYWKPPQSPLEVIPLAADPPAMPATPEPARAAAGRHKDQDDRRIPPA